MATPRINYVFDPSGISAANVVQGEQHVITEANYRDFFFIVPKYAPFFIDSIQISYNLDGSVRFLTEGVDFYGALPFIGATRSIGKPVYGAIAFNNLLVSGVVSIRYQTLGGLWVVDDQLILTTIATLAYNPKIVSWDMVSGIPNIFPPIDHEWNLVDMVGEAEVVGALGRIEAAILAGITDSFRQHILRLDDPHNTTKEQVGLDKVENYGPATGAQATAGSSTDTLITPATLKLVLGNYYTGSQIDQLLTGANVDLTSVYNAINGVDNRLSTHIADRNNPHGVDAIDVNLGSVENLAVVTLAETEIPTPPRKYLTFDIFKAFFDVKVVDKVSSFVNNAIATALAAYRPPLSANGGNLLQARSDGLYYGIEAPADVAILYVNAVTGLDTNTGTIAAPLKTIQNALARGPAGINRTLYLFNGQDHLVLPEAEVAVRGGTLNIRPYGPNIDALPIVQGDASFNSVAGRDLNTTIVAGNFRVINSNGLLLQIAVALYPTQGAFITTEGISLRAGVPTTGDAMSSFDGSFHHPFQTGSWDIYWGNVTLPSPSSRFLSSAAITPIAAQFRIATLFGTGKVTEANSKNKTISVLPYHVSSTQNDEFARKFIASANISSKVYNGFNTNLNPPNYAPVIQSTSFTPASVTVDADLSELYIFLTGLEPGVQTTVGPIAIQTEDGFVYSGGVGGATYKNYIVFGDSNGHASIREKMYLNKPPQGAYSATVVYGAQAQITTELIVTSSINTVQSIYPVAFRNSPISSTEFYFPGSAGASFTLASGSLPAGITMSAVANQRVVFSGSSNSVATNYSAVFRSSNVAGGFDEIRVLLTLNEEIQVINPTITSFSASPDPTAYTQVFDVITTFRQAKPNTVYTAVVYQNVYGNNVLCAILGAFNTNSSGNADLYYQGTDDVYGTADTVVAQLTTYIAEGNYTGQQMVDVGASGVAPYVVAQASINHTFAGVRTYNGGGSTDDDSA